MTIIGIKIFLVRASLFFIKSIVRGSLLLCLVSVVYANTQPNNTASTQAFPADPFNSVMWESMLHHYFPGEQRVFDSKLIISSPASAENQFQVPVTIDASAFDDVQEMVVVADLNPIPHILTLRPLKAKPFIGFRVKLQQATPIHVGVRTSDNVWHLAGTYVDAAGGGCTAAATAHGTDNWMQTLGDTRAITKRDGNGDARVALRIQHPMDTGLASGIPAFYLNSIVWRDAEQRILAELDLYEPVSENPVITIKPSVGPAQQPLHVSARDTEANEYQFVLTMPALDAQ